MSYIIIYCLTYLLIFQCLMGGISTHPTKVLIVTYQFGVFTRRYIGPCWYQQNNNIPSGEETQANINSREIRVCPGVCVSSLVFDETIGHEDNDNIDMRGFMIMELTPGKIVDQNWKGFGRRSMHILINTAKIQWKPSHLSRSRGVLPYIMYMGIWDWKALFPTSFCVHSNVGRILLLLNMVRFQWEHDWRQWERMLGLLWLEWEC